MKNLSLILVITMLFSFISCKQTDKPQDTGMPDPNIIRVQDSVRWVNMVYGTDNIITLYKPDDARFEITPPANQNATKKVSLMHNDKEWRADIGGILSSEEPFAEFYFDGTLSNADEYESFNQEVSDLKMNFMGNSVFLIKTTYKKSGDENIYESYFVGYEFEDTLDGKPIGKGLMGFKIYGLKNEVSVSTCKMIFAQLFYTER